MNPVFNIHVESSVSSYYGYVYIVKFGTKLSTNTHSIKTFFLHSLYSFVELISHYHYYCYLVFLITCDYLFHIV